MSALKRNPQFPASTPHEVLGPGTNWRGILRGPSQLDRSPSGSPIPGILQARTVEWAAISFSNAGK